MSIKRNETYQIAFKCDGRYCDEEYHTAARMTFLAEDDLKDGNWRAVKNNMNVTKHFCNNCKDADNGN